MSKTEKQEENERICAFMVQLVVFEQQMVQTGYALQKCCDKAEPLLQDRYGRSNIEQLRAIARRLQSCSDESIDALKKVWKLVSSRMEETEQKNKGGKSCRR